MFCCCTSPSNRLYVLMQTPLRISQNLMELSLEPDTTRFPYGLNTTDAIDD